MTTVDIRVVSDRSLAVGSAARGVTIDGAKETGGSALGCNGGEPLLLAIGGCYSDVIFREAGEPGISERDCRSRFAPTGRVIQ